MANKADRLYFENLIEAAESSCDAARYLVSCLKDYSQDNMPEMLEKMHEFEHAGDLKKHKMSESLAKAFVTPIDREDLAMVSHRIDDVTDSIEEVLQRFSIDSIDKVTPDAIEFAEKIVASCELMKGMLCEFQNFKKPLGLRKMIIELNHLEEECDQLYLSVMKKTCTCSDNVLEVLFWRDVYNGMEDCVDGCEKVGDCIETVVMKNT